MEVEEDSVVYTLREERKGRGELQGAVPQGQSGNSPVPCRLELLFSARNDLEPRGRDAGTARESACASCGLTEEYSAEREPRSKTRQSQKRDSKDLVER